ncbi:hypothetical protein Vretimale_1036 [Volvox reticuliferus]|uniref:UBX domain-containing protein 11 n=1 Tax=Volvox reticuliferus TaxID=1737510 RepID=A0A8J4FRI0_9CHLO|nr:hypothetical protein Vretifemale_10465 [Volvox reticuliferus]GIL94927.1 hypothetical protein Vretimale_1036 [Volvox reticuliferus]
MAEQLYRKRISPATSSDVDDLVSKNVLAQLRRDPPPRPPAQGHADHGKLGIGGSSGSTGAGGGMGRAGGGAGLTKGGTVEASDLISTMAKRLGALEREMKERQSLLQQVQADNILLKNKLRVAEEEIAKRALAAIEPRDDSAAVMHLRAENARLRAQLKYAWKQAEEMKAFLNDYGMVWMGEPEAEMELNGLQTADDANSSGTPILGAGFLQTLSPEASDPWGPRRSSHSGAAPGPSSAAAGTTAPVIGRAGEASSRSFRVDPATSTAAKRSCSFSSATAATVAASSSPTSATVSRPASSLQSPRTLPALSASALSPRLSRAPPVDLVELQAKVEELNDLAGDGCGQVIRDAAGQHVLAMQDPVNLVIYRDGLQIHTLPAKPFSDPASTAVLRDILDGYFPYVLKRDFPDGVPLRVVDRSSETFTSTPPKRGGGTSTTNGRGGNIRTFDDIDTHGSGPEPMSRDKFLSRLPQAVIKNGKVIEIRSDISKMLGTGPGDGGKADIALISTPVDALLSTLQRNHLGPSLPPPSRDGQPPTAEVTTLQVKSVDGKQTYILKFKYDDTIANLRTCLDAHHAKAGQTGLAYEIRSAFPARAYTDVAETLRQVGLVPNATLFLRAV